ncbi:alkaline phosphatase D family protein [Marininema halotolerans]|uniref:Alkaline phosphatase D n=1 Tax=Marininema halotolerans TaxID=1155944 RepID=A0A1I6T6J9_9BACL|nr:alkaline phosphatase D family protein [Marininema halotolerans]SFS84822.1 alkaline phosphatase D [Marininema halotolerans]
MDSNDFDKGRRIFLKSLLTGSAMVVAQSLSGGLVTKIFADEKKGPTLQAFDLPIFQPKQAIGKGFRQSVASGDPTSTGAILWTRVDPGTEGVGVTDSNFNNGLVQWLDDGSKPPNNGVRKAIEAGQFIMVEVSEDPQFKNLALRCYTPIWSAFDHVVKIDLDGQLQPQRTYFYRFITKSGLVSQTGRFKTLPPVGAHLSSTKFAYVTCQDYTNGYFHAPRFIAEEELDFFVHLGDYIYAEVEYGNVSDRRIQLPSGGKHAKTIEDYRLLYQLAKADESMQLLHQNHAMIAIWDDHEFANDSYFPAMAPDDTHESNPTRRFIANQVWFEYTPARVKFDKNKSFTDFRIYRSFSLGNLAEIILTDERLYRSAPPCGSDTSDKFFAKGCKKMFDPKQSMLGNSISNQRDWMLNQMRNSKNVWKIWANGVQFTPMKILGRYMNLDAWDGYSGERAMITSELKKAGVSNWITLTGDLHSYEAALIKDNYKKDHDKDALGVEFMVGAISSGNFADMVKDKVNDVLPFAKKKSVKSSNSYPIPKDRFEELFKKLDEEDHVDKTRKKSLQNREQAGKLADHLIDGMIEKLSKLIHLENPWLKLFNSIDYGYAIMELSHNKATWSAYSVKDIKSKTPSGKSLLFQCEVPRDRAELRILKG